MRSLHTSPSTSLSVIAVLLGAGALFSLKAQTTPGLEWQSFQPVGEEFRILIPKNPSEEVGKYPYHRMELTTRLYMSGDKSGPLFAVASLSGIKSNPAAYSDFQRLNSYVDAFKNWFAEKVRGKEVRPKLTLVGDKTLNGHTGREYRLTIADLSGSAHVYATKRRFYAVVMLNKKEDSELQERFLSSFVLPEKIVEPPVAAAPPPQPEASPAAAPTEGKKQAAEGQKEEATEGEPAKVATAENKGAEAAAEEKKVEPGKKGPVNGGLLNGRALYLPKPEYPPEAASVKVSGSVTVQITIDEVGAVIAAKAISGPPVLHQVCVNAALQARFSPTMLMGEPVKVSGVLTYNFVN